MKLTHVFVFAALLGLTGCDKPKEGPKLADHQAAHRRTFHPDIPSGPARKASVYDNNGNAGAGAQTRPASRTAAASGPAPIGSPLLFINGETITVPEILEPIYEELKHDARTLSPQAYMGSMQRAIRRQIDMHVSTMLIYQEAKKTYPDKAMEAFDKEVENQLKNIVQDRYGGVFAKYETHLKSMELSMADVRARIKRQLMVTQYVRDRFKPMLHDPSRRQLHSYYQDHLKDYTTPERAELLLIEIPIDAMLDKPRNVASADEIAAATRKAVAQLKRAREELDSGVEFAAVARAYSKGPKASQGGAWGEIGPGSLQGRWAKAAEVLFKLPENQTSDVIQSTDAVFIVRCGKRTPARQISFEDTQTKLVENMRDDQFAQLSQEHVSELLSKATVYPVQEFTMAVMAAAPRPPVVVPDFDSRDLADDKK